MVHPSSPHQYHSHHAEPHPSETLLDHVMVLPTQIVFFQARPYYTMVSINMKLNTPRNHLRGSLQSYLICRKWMYNLVEACIIDFEFIEHQTVILWPPLAPFGKSDDHP